MLNINNIIFLKVLDYISKAEQNVLYNDILSEAVFMARKKNVRNHEYASIKKQKVLLKHELSSVKI